MGQFFLADFISPNINGDKYSHVPLKPRKAESNFLLQAGGARLLSRTGKSLSNQIKICKIRQNIHAKLTILSDFY